MLADVDLDEEDGNWGIDVYCQAVVLLMSKLKAGSSE